MPLLAAARHVLFVRLQAVRDYLPGVHLEAQKDPEHVHQLRVSTRRAGAVLRIFADCLPHRLLRTAKQRLRSLRQAAGVARDWDVMALDLAQRHQAAVQGDWPGLDLLLGYALGLRAAAQPELEKVVGGQRQDFELFLTTTLAEVRLPEDKDLPNLIDLARRTLAQLRGEFEQATAGDLDDYAHLHQVRIAGKRLRYALEVFGDCFGPELRDSIYPRIEEMQGILGRANDSHVACGRLEALRTLLKDQNADWKRYQPGLERLLRAHRRMLLLARKQFLEWLTNWRNQGSEALLNLILQPV
jgi:CHAD domain-containing protein